MATTSKYMPLKLRDDKVVTQMIIAGVVVIAMMIFGVLMLAVQGGLIDVSPAMF